VFVRRESAVPPAFVGVLGMPQEREYGRIGAVLVGFGQQNGLAAQTEVRENE
jgi:hypothetical protein